MGILRDDRVLVIELQGPDEGVPELRQEVQRAAQEGHVATDGLAAGQAGDGLVHHRLEDGGRQVLPGGTLVDQGLDIGLREHAAAGRDGVDHAVVLRVLVQAGGVGLQEGGHLVDEGAGAAGADTVHPLLNIAVFEIDDLRVLAAQLYGDVCLGSKVVEGARYGDHLLHEGNPQTLCQGQTAGARDDGGNRDIACHLIGLLHEVEKGLFDIGEMALVVGEEEGVSLVHDGYLDRSRADINAHLAETIHKNKILSKCIIHNA